MTYKHQGIKAVIDHYGDLLVDPSMVESFLMTHASRKFAPHMMASYIENIERCIKVREKEARESMRSVNVSINDGADSLHLSQTLGEISLEESGQISATAHASQMPLVV